MALPAIQAANWRKRVPKLVALGLAIVCIALLVSYFNADQFYVYVPELRGAKYLAAADVVPASGVVGYNVFFIEPRKVEKAVAALPVVKSVQVAVAVPNRVVIAVQEREPKLIWQRGAESYWVDDEGVALPIKAERPELPVMRDLDQTPIKIGQKTPVEGTAAALALRQNWKDAPQVLEWSNARGISFTNDRGWKIYLGDAADMPGKMAKYRATVALLLGQQTQIKFIDLGKGEPYYQ